MQTFRCAVSLILTGLIFGFSPPVLAGGSDPLEPGRLVQIALDNNEKLRSLREKTETHRVAVDPAASFDNPRLQAGAMNLPVDSYEFDEEPMTSKDLALMQKIPFYGKREQRAKRAIARYRISRAEKDAFQIKLAHDVRRTIFDWWRLGEIIKLREEEQTQLRSFVEIARSRYETGKGIQADVQRAETRLSRIEDNLLRLNQRLTTVRQRLTRLMGGESIPTGVQPTLPEINPSLADLHKLKQRLPERSPRLRADSEQIQAARSGVKLAELDYYPDVDVGVRYRQREDRDDFASFMLTIPLPIWATHKEGNELESKRHQLEQYRSLYEDRRDDLTFRLEEAWYELKRARDQQKLYGNQLIPQTEGTLDSTLSAYRVGNVDFVSLLDAEIEWFRVKSEFVRLRTDRLTALSKLSEIMGYEQMEVWQ